MFTGVDVELMETKLLTQIAEACGLMGKARKWIAADMFARPDLVHKIMGDMDVRLVMHAHGLVKQVKPGNSTLIWKRSPTTSRKRWRLLVAI